MFGALEEILKKMEENEYNVICLNCGEKETMKISKEFITYKCGCGCQIYYRSKPTRPYATKKFISSKTYFQNKNKQEGVTDGTIPKGDAIQTEE